MYVFLTDILTSRKLEKLTSINPFFSWHNFKSFDQVTSNSSLLQSSQLQWCIAKNGGGYTQRGVANGLKVHCLFVITEVSIRCQKNPEVGIRRIPANTPNTPLATTTIKGRLLSSVTNAKALYCVFFMRDLVTLTFDLLTLNSCRTWRVMRPTLPPSMKTLRLSVIELRVITFPIGYH